MSGKKTLMVGGGVAALLWMMNAHASAGDLTDKMKNGTSTFSDAYQNALNHQNAQNGAPGLLNGYQGLQGASESESGSQGVAGGFAEVQNTLQDLGAGAADDSGLSGPAVELSPSAAKPGQQVLITVPTCIQPTSGVATSAVFANNGSVSLTRNPRGAGLAGTATVIKEAQNGQWSVNITCGSGWNSLNGVTSLTVYGAGGPTSPPKAGGGGSVARGDVGMTAGGIALVVGGVGYGLWTLRRRGIFDPHVG